MDIQPVNMSVPNGGLTTRPGPHEKVSAVVDAQMAKVVVPQQGVQAAADAQTSQQQLDHAVKAANDFVSSLNNNNLQFSVDKETGKTVVKVIDAATNEVIKQFPSEEMLAIAKALDDIKGLLVKQKA